MENFLSILSTTEFAEMDHDPTVCIEGKVKRTFRGIKNKLPSFIYSKFDRPDHHPGSSMGLQKFGYYDLVNNLVNDLAQQLKPLSESQYTIKNGESFTKRLKEIKIPPEFKMVSFDVVSLFTNAAID